MLKDTIPSIEPFADTYKMDCPAAINRLVTSGVPATVEHRAAAECMHAEFHHGHGLVEAQHDRGGLARCTPCWPNSPTRSESWASYCRTSWHGEEEGGEELKEGKKKRRKRIMNLPKHL